MGQQFSGLPAGYQPGVDSWYGVICTNFHFIPDFRDPHIQDYCLQNSAYTGCFAGLLLLLTWWYGQSNFDNRFDPVRAAHQERATAIKERDDAQHAWQVMGTKHEHAIQTTLRLQAEFRKAFKDLPWLEQRNFELAEENIVQHNEIERLKVFEQKYNELLQQVAMHGSTAEPPEYYQRRSEQVQRQLEISNKLLERSEYLIKALEEKLGTQQEKAQMEKEWLRAQLKKNSRSTAYWAKHRANDRAKPAWGMRCACTESEIAYGLKDQTPRIVELEATVAARNLTITHLRESRRNDRKNNNASSVTTHKTSGPATKGSESDITTGSQIGAPALVHTCEHDQQCRNLGQQVADDARTITQLREECQDLKDAASNNNSSNATETDAMAKLEGELAAKEVVIADLRKQKAKASQELGAKNETINDLRKKNETASEELATNNEVIKVLREDKRAAKEKLAAKDNEIDNLREKTAADGSAATEISRLGQELSERRQELVDERRVHAECEQELGQQESRVQELETAQRGLEDTIKEKDREIDDLEQANQEIAGRPDPESAENLRLLTAANTDLVNVRREKAECIGRLETQTTKISILEAAGRELETTVKAKDDSIAKLEEQINNAPSNDSFERQNQDHQKAIDKKDQDYQALYDLYQKMLDQKKRAEVKHDEAMQSLRQTCAAKQQEVHHWGTQYNNASASHTGCDGRINDLTTQLRQGADTYTDLQNKYNTQAQELDVANSNVSELRSEVSKLRQTVGSLEKMNSSSESNFERYRVEGENRVRPVWQAKFDAEMSTQVLKLNESEGEVFKLRNQLQQAKNQANPLREMQLKAREDAVQAKEDAFKPDRDTMDHDQQGSSKGVQEIKALESKLAAANKEAGDARVRNRGIQSQLTKERKERAEEKARHERELRKEREEGEKKSNILKIRLEKENPLKITVSSLQDQIVKLSKDIAKLQTPESDGE